MKPGTPLPWKETQNSYVSGLTHHPVRYLSIDSGNRIVASHHFADQQAEADFRFIVHAVNLHARLVEALRRLVLQTHPLEQAGAKGDASDFEVCTFCGARSRGEVTHTPECAFANARTLLHEAERE